MSETALPVWRCAFDGLQADTTVGAKFNLNCSGEIAVNWGQGEVVVAFPDKEQAYTLHVLQADRLEPLKAQLTVTGYKAGEHAPEYIRLMQGEQGFEVAKPKWKIQSVLPPGQKVEPVPSFGPWSLSLPYWVLIAAGLAALFLVLLVARSWRRYQQRSRMLADLSLHKTALSPLNQFYRDARQLRRRLHTATTAEAVKGVADELNREFRLYVLRQFEVPALDWSDQEIVKDIRKRHFKVHQRAAEPLLKTLREMSRMSTQPKPLQTDVEQMHRMSLNTVERVEAARQEVERSKR